MFRREALDRLSTPEELDELMRITSPRLWLSAVALALVVGAGLVWSVLTVATTTVAASGGITAMGAHPSATLFVPIDQAARVSPGMPVSLKLLGLSGPPKVLTGSVTHVGDLPATPPMLMQVFQNSTYATAFTGANLVVPVKVRLSSQTGAISPGTLSLATITVSRQRLIRLLFP